MAKRLQEFEKIFIANPMSNIGKKHDLTKRIIDKSKIDAWHSELFSNENSKQFKFLEVQI